MYALIRNTRDDTGYIDIVVYSYYSDNFASVIVSDTNKLIQSLYYTHITHTHTHTQTLQMAALELKVEKLVEELAEERAANSNNVVRTAMAHALVNGTFRGNIQITSDAELVVMLPVLKYITTIDGDLYIRGLSWRPNLDDVLALLVRITGALNIGGCSGLQSLANALPLLVEVGKSITFAGGNTRLQTITSAFPLLAKVGTSFTMQSTDQLVATMDGAFPLLAEIGTTFYMSSNSQLVSMDGAFPLLAKVGTSFTLVSNNKLVSMDGAFPLLKVGTRFEMQSNAELVSMDGSFLVMDSVASFYLAKNKKLKSMNDGTFGKLTKTTTGGGFDFFDSKLESMDGLFPLLASVDGAFLLQSHTQVQTMDGAFPLLSTVGTSFSIHSNAKLTTLGADGGFKALSSIGGFLYFYANGDNGAGNVENNPGLVSFCESAKEKLCGLTSSYNNWNWAHDSDNCC